LSIEIKNITFGYDNFKLEANLDIKTGEFLSILGPSGCGKTTLLRIIAGFNNPLSGSLILNGNRDITALPAPARNIGMVFQDYALFPHLNVFRNISYGLEIRKFPADKIKKRVFELLKLVKLEGYEKRSVHELSGGEKQRIALARALAPEPELLLFDEPLSALDVKLRKVLRREIRRIQQDVGFTAVYVTHDQEEAMSISDRISVMNSGRICQTGSPEQLYNEPSDYFTADFIGTMNRISTPEGSILFRPENCTPAGREDQDGTIIEAAVLSSEYRGGYYNCEAETSQNEILCFYSSRRLESGIKLKLVINEISRF
jgi:ABC-type Fe3+/spermidine/putrescine transport system ATPase subunit